MRIIIHCTPFNSDDEGKLSQIRVYISLKMVIEVIDTQHDGLPITISSPTNVEFDHRNCYGMLECNYRKSPLWRSATRDRSAPVESCTRNLHSSLVHVLDFSRSDSIIIHPPSPPSARLNYPGLNEGWIEPASSPWKKKKQAVEEKQIGGKIGHACIAGRRWI